MNPRAEATARVTTVMVMMAVAPYRRIHDWLGYLFHAFQIAGLFVYARTGDHRITFSTNRVLS